MKEDKILVTGGLGFIGINVASLLVEQRRKVLLFDNLSSQIHGAVPNLSSLPLLRSDNVEVVRGDVCRQMIGGRCSPMLVAWCILPQKLVLLSPCTRSRATRPQTLAAQHRYSTT
jgi:nucleoside-diphosphate-sugar epimerase